MKKEADMSKKIMNTFSTPGRNRTWDGDCHAARDCPTVLYLYVFSLLTALYMPSVTSWYDFVWLVPFFRCYQKCSSMSLGSIIQSYLGKEIVSDILLLFTHAIFYLSRFRSRHPAVNCLNTDSAPHCICYNLLLETLILDILDN